MKLLQLGVFALLGCQPTVERLRIATEVELAWTSAAVHLDSVPSSVIPALTTLELVDVRGAFAGPGDETAVADEGVHQILIFDPAGALIDRIGRQGNGPAEFQSLSLVAFWEDSLAVYDQMQRRLSILRKDGSLIRQQEVDNAGLMLPSIIGLRARGIPVLKGIIFAPPPGGQSPFPIRGAVLTLDGSDRDTVATFDEGLWHQLGPRFYSWRATATMSDTGVWVGAGGRPELRLVSWDGTTDAVLRWEAQARAVTVADRAKVVAVARERRGAPGLTDADRFADSIPYFGRVLSDPLGGLWLIASTAPYETPDSAWYINESLRTIQGLALPSHFRPTQVLAGAMLGVRTSEDGSPQVVRYRLRRSRVESSATETPLPASTP